MVCGVFLKWVAIGKRSAGDRAVGVPHRSYVSKVRTRQETEVRAGICPESQGWCSVRGTEGRKDGKDGRTEGRKDGRTEGRKDGRRRHGACG